MTTLRTSKIDYSNRDFPTIIDSMIRYIKTKFPLDYTDFSEGKLGMMYLESCAWVGDMLSYMIDIAANEAFMPTCRQLSSAFKLANLLGYEPKQPTAASVTLQATTTDPIGYTQDCTIRANTQIVLNGVYFELLTDYVIPAGTPSIEGPTFCEGRTYTDTFTANGLPFQSYTLTEKPIIANSLTVYVNEVLWTEYESLVFIGDNNGYALTLTSDYSGLVRFGDGVSGRIPANLDIIEVHYRIGGGVVGNIAALSINSKSITAYLADSTPVTLYLTNNNPGSGGADAETLDQIKLNAPLYYRTHRNLITQEDYNTLINNFSDPTYGRIARGIAVPRYGRTNSSANEVDAYVWARGAGNTYVPCSLGLKQALLDYLNERAVIVVDVFVNDGLIRSIDVYCSAIVDLGFSSATTFRTSITTAITNFFTRDDIYPGDTFFVSQLYDTIHNVPGVIQVNLGIPGDYKLPTENKTISLATISGLSTLFYFTTGGLPVDEFVGGTITFTSGIHNTRVFQVIRNTADTVTIGVVLAGVVAGDTVTLNSELVTLEDIPVNQNEIFQLGTLGVAIYYYSKDTRSVILIPE